MANKAHGTRIACQCYFIIVGKQIRELSQIKHITPRAVLAD